MEVHRRQKEHIPYVCILLRFLYVFCNSYEAKQMNAEDITQQLAVAEADLAIAKASIQRNEAEIAAARATLDYAKVTFERMDNLRQSNSVSQTDVDKSRQSYQVAAAHLEQAEKQKLEIEAEIVRHEAQIKYFHSKLAETQLKAILHHLFP